MRDYPVKWITTELAVGYAPRSHSDLDAIRAQGIAAIVNLCAECYDLADSEKKAGFEVYFVPVVDEEAPVMEDLEEAVAWIVDRLQFGSKVLVHCRFGIGRTGTFVAAYFMNMGQSLKAAIRKIKHTPAIPMSRNQWDLLERYAEKLGVSRAGFPELQKEIEQPSDAFFQKWETMLDFFKK